MSLINDALNSRDSMESSDKKKKDAVADDSEAQVVFDSRLKAASSLIEEERFIEAWQVLYEMTDEEKQTPEIRGMLAVIREQAKSTLETEGSADGGKITEAEIAAVPTAKAGTKAKKKRGKAAPKKAVKTAKQAKKPRAAEKKKASAPGNKPPLKQMALVAIFFIIVMVGVTVLSNLRTAGGESASAEDHQEGKVISASLLPANPLNPDIASLAFQQDDTYSTRRPTAQHQRPNSSSAPALSTKDLSLSVDGALASDDGDSVIVRFEDGIFARSYKLTTDAMKILTGLGEQLEAYEGELHVTIVGHTDNAPVEAKRDYADNFELGMLRAMEVVKHLKHITDMPREAFDAVSYGQRNPPYPNDSDTSRARNHTVTIRISHI